MPPSQEPPLVEVCVFRPPAPPIPKPCFVATHTALELIEVALDVSANGRLPLPPYPQDSPSLIHSIALFLYSYDTGRNFTITNGTATANNASLGDIMFQEPGSTVKHVKWIWPDCLVGDGPQTETGSDRGVYNVSLHISSCPPFSSSSCRSRYQHRPPHSPPQISIRQSFRLNGVDRYTIFDLPISVTNRIEARADRPSCDALDNPLLPPETIRASADFDVPVLFAPGDATTVQTGAGGAGEEGDGLGPTKPGASPGQGLGSGASRIWMGGESWMCVAGMAFALGMRLW